MALFRLSAPALCCSFQTKHKAARSLLKLVGNRRNLCFAVSQIFHPSPSFALGRAPPNLPLAAQPTQHYAAFCSKPLANSADQTYLQVLYFFACEIRGNLRRQLRSGPLHMLVLKNEVQPCSHNLLFFSPGAPSHTLVKFLST